MGCLLSCKDTNFKANHNRADNHYHRSGGVCYLAKIRILKQITTGIGRFAKTWWCLLSCKDTNFKANHNTKTIIDKDGLGVCYLAKIRILKQITTIQYA